MRILAISDYFPPHYIGGYELACFEIMSILASRGHEVQVLTSNHQRPGVEINAADPFPVDRSLRSGLRRIPQFPFTFNRRYQDVVNEIHESRKVQRAIKRFRPDVISAWRMLDVSPGVLLSCLASDLPVVFSISDRWLLQLQASEDTWLNMWSRPAWSPRRRILKGWLRRLLNVFGIETSLDTRSLKNFHFFSKYLDETYRRGGLAPQVSTVIHHGVDLATYKFRDGSLENQNVRILYVGRLLADKGVHIAVQAFAKLLQAEEFPGLEFHLAGAGDDQYLASLKSLIKDLGLGERVKFLGGLPRQAISALYNDYDILVFPSIWPEPFSVTLIEAMASGIPIVGTTTGGSGEILCDGENALIYPPEDSDAMANQLRRLIQDHCLRNRLRTNARSSVEAISNIDVNVTKLECFLLSAQ